MSAPPRTLAQLCTPAGGIHIPGPRRAEVPGVAATPGGGTPVTLDDVRRHWQDDIERRQTRSLIITGIALAAVLAAGAALWIALTRRPDILACSTTADTVTEPNRRAGGDR